LHLWYLVAIVLSVLPFTDSVCTCCLSFHLRILIAPLVSCGHCVVCPSIYGFWLHLLSVLPFTDSDYGLWYLVAIVLSVRPFTDSDCTFGILWPLCCLSFHLRNLMAPLVSCSHCVVCPSIYGFWLHLIFKLFWRLLIRKFRCNFKCVDELEQSRITIQRLCNNNEFVRMRKSAFLIKINVQIIIYLQTIFIHVTSII
jgi:hypothetical protein